MKDAVGIITGMDDTQLAGAEAMRIADMAEDSHDTESSIRLADQGNLLWSYQNEGRIYGVPVVREHCGLKLDTDEKVSNAFELVRRPRLMLLLVGADTPDTLEKYNDLLDAVYDGRAEIVDESRQFDSDKSAFLVWVRYNELSYRLNPRYNYLLEE